MAGIVPSGANIEATKLPFNKSVANAEKLASNLTTSVGSSTILTNKVFSDIVAEYKLAVILVVLVVNVLMLLSTIVPSTNGSVVESRLVISITSNKVTCGSNCCLDSTGSPVLASGTGSLSTLMADNT